MINPSPPPRIPITNPSYRKFTSNRKRDVPTASCVPISFVRSKMDIIIVLELLNTTMTKMIIRSRRYQMNEVARCTQIALGIAAASGGSADPVALVDLGTGAGLELGLDRYRYRVGADTYGPAAAGLSLACDVRGPIIPPKAELPRIATRVGVDLDPVRLEDPAARASAAGLHAA